MSDTQSNIDWEAEYNNRARVPEHPRIFARWEREAVAYRAEATSEGRAEIGTKYGPSPRQTIDLFWGRESDGVPLALFVHGGYWRSLDPSLFSQMARGMNTRGVTVAICGYDLSPQVSIGEIITQTQNACIYLWRRFGRRLMVSGHSAGGHLAACMVATDWKEIARDVPADLVPTGYVISGLYDLSPLLHLSTNADFKLDEAEARRISPLFWPVAAGRALEAVVGAEESSEFLRQSKIIADGWRERGVQTRYEEIPRANHFTVCDPMTDPGSDMVARMTALAERAQRI
jgi:arylformamidase